MTEETASGEREAFRSGFCAIVGRPNVGKSTLLNALIGARVAITTPVPQTTRHVVRGVLHEDDVQVVFVDTPGLHKARTMLGNRLNEVARDAFSDVDVSLFVVDGAGGVGRGDRFVAGMLEQRADHTIVAVNKIDRMSKAAQLPAIAAVAGLAGWSEIVPVSAKTGEGVPVIRDLIARRMPLGPPYFPRGQITDQTLEQQVAEHIREQAIVRMREEVPHSVAVVVDEMLRSEPGDLTVVHATLYVERESQKGIVIGHHGGVLRDIGTHARSGIERVLGTRVYLDLRVKLLKDWQGNPRSLDRLGY